MSFLVFLWLSVWGGMFSGIYNIKSPAFLSSPFSFFQGIRALLPVAVAYICLLWILAEKSRFPFFRTSLSFLFYYCLVGLVASFFLSPDKITAFYWGAVFLSPFLVVWFALEKEGILDGLRKMIFINYGIVILVAVMLFPEAYGKGLGTGARYNFYDLPFQLGELRANGVGRYALLVAIISFVRLISQSGKKRYLWLGLLLPSLFLLAQTQSRTALLGLAVVSMLFVFLRGMDLRLILAGPAAAYIIWLSGIKWRAHGEFERLVDLTGREYTWQKGLAQIKQSPFFGWGFHADRILLQSEHMHNSYLHAAIHGGFIGAVFFACAIISIWALILRSGLIKKVKFTQGPDQPLLMESILILGFLTSRSFFESTGAFYGVDLLLLVPTMAYIYYWVEGNQYMSQVSDVPRFPSGESTVDSSY